MPAIRMLGQLAAFLQELAVLAAAGYWGFSLPAGLAVRLIAMLAAPALLAFGWGMLAAPRARVVLPGWARTGFVTAWFAAGAVALAAAGASWLAVALAVAFVVSKFLLGMWPASGPPAFRQDPPPETR
ncbi:MAG: YrdB family protein [Nocardiopsaceae bacterium]|nr:YrdB family protein [Nocardiopsaceae bacterium]